MRIIIDIGHPGHVHFFKNFIWEMKKKGHELLIIASKKDVTLELLDAYKIQYIISCKRYSGIYQAYELLLRDIQLLKLGRKFKPDILMGINNTIAAHVSRVTNAKSIIFTDTEHAKLANAITFPFCDVICTPSCYNERLGNKQIRYNGYHELAYLHPNRFTPNPVVLDEIGLTTNDPYIILRFVSWQASHDIGHQGIRDKIDLVRALEPYGRVLITSEGSLPQELENLRIRVSPEKLHDLLYYATMYIGEGATTASECAVLGTHAIYVNTLRLGYTDEEEEKYELLYNFSDSSELETRVLDKAFQLLKDPNLRANGKHKREKLLKDKIDVTAFMIGFIENYPDSFNQYSDDCISSIRSE
jgi:hypothetical protein